MKRQKSYRELEIFKKSLDLFYRTHQLSLTLPKYETYELGSQVRRSADSINSNIVEGYGRRKYKRDFIRFLTYSQASNDETKNHLEKIARLYPNHKIEVCKMLREYDALGAQLYQFIQYVEKNWRT